MHDDKTLLTAGEAPDTGWREYREVPLTPILKAALAAFQDQGYHGTAVRDIARGAQLTMPALYYHHGNKEGILLALLEIAIDDLLQHIDRGEAAAGDDARQRFVNIATAVALHVTRRNHLARLHAEYRFLGETTRKQYVAQRARVSAHVDAAIGAGVEAGCFRVDDIAAATRAVLGLLQSVLEWYRPKGQANAEEVAERYVQYALRLVGDTGERTRRPANRRGR